MSVDAKSRRSSSGTRDIQPLQRKHVKRCLIKYHKSLLVDFVGMAANANVKTLTNIQFMLRFEDIPISQVLDDTNVNRNDAYDVDDDDDDDDNVVFSEDQLDEWSDILIDDELFEMVMDNISLSQMDTSSFLGNQPNDSCDVDIVDNDNDLLTAFAGIYGV